MKYKTFAAALLASISMPVIAHAQEIEAEVSVDLNLRVGPSTDYRVITTIPDGDDITVYRCASTYNWCDVGWNDWRGWVFADYIQYYYEGEYVPLVEYVEVIEVPVIQVFVFEEYATAYYADRPFYDELQPYFSVEIEFEIDDEDDIDDEDREREVAQDPPRDQDQDQDQAQDGDQDQQDDQDQAQDGDQDQQDNQDQAQDGSQDEMQDPNQDQAQDANQDQQDPNQDQAQDGSQDEMQDPDQDQAQDGSQDEMQDPNQDQAQDGSQDQQRRLDGQADAGADVQVDDSATGAVGADVDAGGAATECGAEGQEPCPGQ